MTPEDIGKALRALASKRLLIGIPEEKNARETGPATNALLGYVHENGSPAKGIPARPFLVPGVTAALPQITAELKKAAAEALKGNLAAIDTGFANAGLLGVSSVKATIQAGIKPMLKESTLIARRLRQPDVHYRVRMQMVEEKWSRARIAAYRKAHGLPPPPARIYLRQAQTPEEATPLDDTSQMLNSITFVIRAVR